MVVAVQTILLGVVWYVLVAFSPLVLIWLGCRVAKLVEAIRDRRAQRRSSRLAQGESLQRLAADLRRLRAELVGGGPTNNIRHTALLIAYDSVLVDTCARLEIPTELAATPDGPERNLERLRAEAAIQEAGVSLHVPRWPAQP